MKERLSIVLVEDDEVACSRFENIADSSDNIAIVGVTNSSGEAVRLIKDNLPDAVILDLELHKGSGSGLDVLSGIGSQLPSSMRPFVLVTTNNTSALIYETARSLGADYILAKHQDDYSEEYAIGLLSMMSDAIRNRHGASDEAAVSPAAQEKRAPSLCGLRALRHPGTTRRILSPTPARHAAPCGTSCRPSKTEDKPPRQRTIHPPPNLYERSPPSWHSPPSKTSYQKVGMVSSYPMQDAPISSSATSKATPQPPSPV